MFQTDQLAGCSGAGLDEQLKTLVRCIHLLNFLSDHEPILGLFHCGAAFELHLQKTKRMEAKLQGVKNNYLAANISSHLQALEDFAQFGLTDAEFECNLFVESLAICLKGAQNSQLLETKRVHYLVHRLLLVPLFEIAYRSLAVDNPSYVSSCVKR